MQRSVPLFTATSQHSTLKLTIGNDGGEGGIRTHGTREGTTVFETVPFDHSGTSPLKGAGRCSRSGLLERAVSPSLEGCQPLLSLLHQKACLREHTELVSNRDLPIFCLYGSRTILLASGWTPFGRPLE